MIGGTSADFNQLLIRFSIRSAHFRFESKNPFNDNIIVVDSNKTPLTVAHELTHLTQGDFVNDGILIKEGKKPSDKVAEELRKTLLKKTTKADESNIHSSDFQARRFERIIANEAVTNCNYFIESLDLVFNDGNRLPVDGLEPKKQANPDEPVLDEPKIQK